MLECRWKMGAERTERGGGSLIHQRFLPALTFCSTYSWVKMKSAAASLIVR